MLKCSFEAIAANWFQNVTDSTCFERLHGVFIISRRENDGGRTIERVEVMCRLDSAESRHPNVEKYDVGFRIANERDRLFAVAGFAGKLIVVEVVNYLPQPIARRTLVIDDQDFHALGPSAGNRNDTEYESS